MAFFLFEGWTTLDYDRYVKNKNKQVTFPKNYFIEVCNLKKLYKTSDKYSFFGREMSFKYDCDIWEAKGFLRNHRNHEIIMKEGKVKYIDNIQVFIIVNSFKTDPIGLGASIGGSGTRFVVLKKNNRLYLLLESDLKYGEIK